MFLFVHGLSAFVKGGRPDDSGFALAACTSDCALIVGIGGSLDPAASKGIYRPERTPSDNTASLGLISQLASHVARSTTRMGGFYTRPCRSASGLQRRRSCDKQPMANDEHPHGLASNVNRATGCSYVQGVGANGSRHERQINPSIKPSYDTA